MVVAGPANDCIWPPRQRVPNLVMVTLVPVPVAQAPFSDGHSLALAGVHPGARPVFEVAPPPGRRGIIGDPVLPGTVIIPPIPVTPPPKPPMPPIPFHTPLPALPVAPP